MEDELITFETAKLAKSKGFNIPTSRFYISESELIINFEDSGSNEREYYFDADSFNENWNSKGWVVARNGGMCYGCKVDNSIYFNGYSAPTQSLLQRWLREVHKIEVLIDKGYYTEIMNKYYFKFSIHPIGSPYYDTYEEALESGLIEALKLIPDGVE